MTESTSTDLAPDEIVADQPATGVADAPGPDAGSADGGPDERDESASVPGGGAADADGAERRSSGSRHDQLVAEGDAAGDYLERLLDILDYDGDIDLDVEGERAVVSIIGAGDVERLIGDEGEVLEALQELSRLAATAETGQRSRLMLDIAGYRARRRDVLAELGRETAEQVLRTGEPVKLAVMNPFERKVIHDAVGTVEGVTSSSEGEEPRRRVVVSLGS